LGKIYFTEPQKPNGTYNPEYLKVLRESAEWLQNINPETYISEVRGFEEYHDQ